MANKPTLGSVVKNVVMGGFNKTLQRLRGAGLDTDSRLINATAKWSGRADNQDWRVRLQLPSGSDMYNEFFGNNQSRLAPLNDLGGFFWPLTPSIVIQHMANYNALSQTHSNYPFQAYKNSQVDSFNIIGEFPVQNQDDAAYWVATVNFLRTMTKMFFGKEQNFKGNPPPILHLSGYGKNMFEKVPVVLNSFNVELRSGIDYISTKQDAVFQRQAPGSTPLHDFDPGTFNPNSQDQTWAPSLSTISVLVTPIYSRESIKSFSLRDFAEGKLNGNGDGNIGFI
jgi:hypothetical protein|tara:strand:+ start:630 stop:1475 length:846 start_codon:yes stop_codon:yes gene_type:complete